MGDPSSPFQQVLIAIGGVQVDLNKCQSLMGLGFGDGGGKIRFRSGLPGAGIPLTGAENFHQLGISPIFYLIVDIVVDFHFDGVAPIIE